MVRCVLRASSSPFLGLMVPVAGTPSVPDHLVMTVLPYNNDLRLHKFKPLRELPEEVRPSKEQVAAVADMVSGGPWRMLLRLWLVQEQVALGGPQGVQWLLQQQCATQNLRWLSLPMDGRGFLEPNMVLTALVLPCCQVSALSLVPRPGSERLAPERTPNPALSRFYTALGHR